MKLKPFANLLPLFSALLVATHAPAAFAELSTNKEVAELSVRIDASTHYTLVGNTAKAMSSNSQVAVIVRSLSNEGQGELTLGPISIPDFVDETLTIENDSVQFNDHLRGADFKLPAFIQRDSATGRLERFFIAKEHVLQVMGQSLTQKGKDIVTHLSVESENAVLSFNFATSDLACSTSKPELLTCQLTAEIVIRAEK